MHGNMFLINSIDKETEQNTKTRTQNFGFFPPLVQITANRGLQTSHRWLKREVYVVSRKKVSALNRGDTFVIREIVYQTFSRE